MSGTDFYYENMVQLAEKLATLVPGNGPNRVYFGNSGTEAIEAAIKMARYHSGRDKFIAFLGGVHGRTMGALSLTGSKVVQRQRLRPHAAGAPYSVRKLLPLRLWPASRYLPCGMCAGH